MKKVSDIELDPAEQLHLLDELQNLLERQIKLTHQGNIRDVESLVKQADCLIAKIMQTGVLEKPENRDRREKLRRLYTGLHLAITAQKAETSDKLSQVRKGRKTIDTYRRNI